jgi:deoxyribose-phosphate aldolase
MTLAQGACGAELARRLIAVTDLTSLNESDDDRSTRDLARLALSSPVKPAAICIWARCLPAARDALRGAIPLCAVANFPDGASDPEAAAAQSAAAVAGGAAEVDVVFPYRALLAGNEGAGRDLVRACREACASRALLKVILETGQLPGPGHIRRAAQIAVEGGAQFLKTSTGKTGTGATPEAAAVLLEVIAQAARRGTAIGFKASGGIRTIGDARVYLDLFDATFGPGSATAANFRIGASALFKELLAAAARSVQE